MFSELSCLFALYPEKLWSPLFSFYCFDNKKKKVTNRILPPILLFKKYLKRDDASGVERGFLRSTNSVNPKKRRLILNRV